MATANTHGEDHFVIMFGGLHVEMTAFKVLGKWLSGSGWTDVLTNASFLIASHLKRTRRAYQIIAAAAEMKDLLQHQGHAKYTTKAADDITDVKEKPPISLLGEGVGFRTLLLTACEGFEGSNLCTVCSNNDTDCTVNICLGPHQIFQVVASSHP